MNDFLQILIEHIKTYPIFRPTDAVKLAIQSALGGDHLIADRGRAIDYCKSEISVLTAEALRETELYRNIGGGYVRINLLPASKILSADMIGRMFAAGAKPKIASQPPLEEYIEILMQAARDGILPFSYDELKAFLDAWDHQPVSHSESYRAAYAPHYRVICREWLPLLDLLATISATFEKKELVTVAIDGMSGSGKTSAAELLAMLYPDDTTVIHADDFFLPPELRTAERLNEIGGNFHYERFKDEIADKLAAQAEILEYRIFDCSIGDYSETRKLRRRRLTVVEGSYSLHPALPRYADVAAYLQIPPAIQADRIHARNGDRAEAFFSKWIPLENAYRDGSSVKTRADLTIDNCI